MRYGKNDMYNCIQIFHSFIIYVAFYSLYALAVIFELLCGVSGWRWEEAGGLFQPADSWTLPQIFILWQLQEENFNQG